MRLRYRNGSERTKKIWAYRDSLKPCPVLRIWNSKKKLDFRFTLSLYGVPAAPAGEVAIDPTKVPRAPENTNPCNGAISDPSLPWLDLGYGVKAIKTYDSQRVKLPDSDYQPTLDTIYIAGLPGEAYPISDKRNVTRFSKSNACGFVKLANTTT